MWEGDICWWNWNNLQNWKSDLDSRYRASIVILGTFANCEKCLFCRVCWRGTTGLPMDRFSWNLVFYDFFEMIPRKLKFHWNLTRITVTLHEDLCTFMMINRWILFRKRNFETKFVEKIKTHVLCSLMFSLHRAVYETMRKNIVEPDKPQKTV